MFNKYLREFYMLSRGEQRALILLGLLVFISLTIRVLVSCLPHREPSGLDQFREEAQSILLALDEMDNLNHEDRPQGAGSGFPRKASREMVRPGPLSRQTVSVVSLNDCDSVSLLPLPGIGPVLAGRIIKYRNLLGGFLNKGQLLEVYGLEHETLDRISPYIMIDTSNVHQLDIDSASFSELLRHPYLEFEDVKALLNYRDLMGSPESAGDIREHALLPDTVLERIMPYLKFP